MTRTSLQGRPLAHDPRGTAAFLASPHYIPHGHPPPVPAPPATAPAVAATSGPAAGAVGPVWPPTAPSAEGECAAAAATGKPRCTLTPAQAFQIYMLKRGSNDIYRNPKGESRSRSLATQFGVSSKTIRDIWNHRTWKLTTLYAEQQALQSSTEDLQVRSC